MATEKSDYKLFQSRFYLKRNSRQTSRHGTNTNVPTVGTHKVCLLIFRKYRPPSNPVSAHTILAYTPPPSISGRIKGYMRDIFCESYQRTTNYVKNNGDAVNAIVKRRIKTSRKGLRSRVRFLTVRKRWEWNFLTVLIANFLDFYFATNP